MVNLFSDLTSQEQQHQLQLLHVNVCSPRPFPNASGRYLFTKVGAFVSPVPEFCKLRSISTCRFAQRVAAIKNNATVNEASPDAQASHKAHRLLADSAGACAVLLLQKRRFLGCC